MNECKILDLARPILRTWASESHLESMVLQQENAMEWYLDNYINLIGYWSYLDHYGGISFIPRYFPATFDMTLSAWVRCPFIDLSFVSHHFIRNKYNNILDYIICVIEDGYNAIKEVLGMECLHGMAHITGGGIEGNLCRIIPYGYTVQIDKSKIRILEIFKHIKRRGNISDAEMLHTFNLGIGFVLVVSSAEKGDIINKIQKYFDCYEIGVIRKGGKKVELINELEWI